MENAKKTALIKQANGWKSSLPIRGVARLSQVGGLVKLSVINLERLNGEYYFLCGEELSKMDELCFCELKASSFEPLAIVFFDGNNLSVVAVGSFSPCEIDEDRIIKNAERKIKKNWGNTQESAVFQGSPYNDEAIADVNYYEIESSPISRKTEDFNEKSDNDDDSYRSENEPSEEKERIPSQDEFASAFKGEFESEESNGYYYKIASELESLFKSYAKESALCNMVENSKWVKIGDGEKSYAVGIIYSSGEPCYVCYALPGFFGEKPQDITGYASFIPTSPFDLKGNGYWVMYQNANNGKCL